MVETNDLIFNLPRHNAYSNHFNCLVQITLLGTFMNSGLSLMLAVAELMQGFSSWGPERKKFILNMKDESWSNCYIVAEKLIKKRLVLSQGRRQVIRD